MPNQSTQAETHESMLPKYLPPFFMEPKRGCKWLAFWGSMFICKVPSILHPVFLPQLPNLRAPAFHRLPGNCAERRVPLLTQRAYIFGGYHVLGCWKWTKGPPLVVFGGRGGGISTETHHAMWAGFHREVTPGRPSCRSRWLPRLERRPTKIRPQKNWAVAVVEMGK